MPVAEVERLVADHWRSVTIPEHIITVLRQMVAVELADLQASAKAETHELAAEHTQLLDRRKTLLDAHLAHAVPLDLHAEENERITRRLAFIESRLEAAKVDQSVALEAMNECLDLAADAHAIYLGLDDKRHIANQAMFERFNIVELDPDDLPRIDAAYAEPFDRLLDPRAHAQALELQRFQQEVRDDATPDTVGVGGWSIDQGVELSAADSKSGTASCARCARKCSIHPPNRPTTRLRVIMRQSGQLVKSRPA